MPQRQPVRGLGPGNGLDSPGRLIVRTTRLFLSSFGWLAAVILAVSAPGKLATQAALSAAGLSPNGLAAYFVTYATDLAWNALLAGAVIHGLSARLRNSNLPGWSRSLAFGWKLWPVMLWNVFRVEITVLLWSLLLIIPGIIATLRLFLTEAIVVLEGAATPDALARSRDLTRGRLWRVALALCPLVPIGAAHLYATFRSLEASPFAMAAVDSVFTVFDQWGVAAALLIYLSVAPSAGVKSAPASPKASPGSPRR